MPSSNGTGKRKAKPSNGVRPTRVYHAMARTRVTNGRDLLPDTDGRKLWPRRARDLIALFTADQGGDGALSEAKRAIIRRCAVIITELEQRELRFCEHGATDLQLEQYSRVAANLRRMLESVGLERAMKEVPNLQTYLHEQGLAE